MKTMPREVFSKYTEPEIFERIKEYPSISAMWENCLREFADNTAICDNGREYTFAETEKATTAFRTVLCSAHKDESKRIGIYSANSFDFVKAFLAITTLGYTAVILPAQLDAGTVFGCCMKYNIGTLVYQPELEQNTALAAQRCTDLTLVRADASADELTPLRPCGAELPCVVMFTGGTTGRSKGALLSNGAVMQGVVNGCYGYHDVFNQRYMLVLPLSHVFGLIRNLLTSLYTGSSIFICRNNKDVFRDIAVFRPTIWVVVPALAEMALTLSKKFGRNMLGADMKTIICGAAAVSPYLVEEYREFGIALFPGYGLTESANLVSGNPESFEKPDSVGIMYPNQEYRIENGELWLRGSNMLECYIGEDEEAYTDGWFRTGDLVRFDEEGFMYITGRIKEIIVLSNGENVSPAEVEAKFNALPFVQDSQVFEDINESGAHILALEIVPRMTELGKLQLSDPNAYMMQELEKVNAKLPGFERVNRIVIRDTDFARTPSMKIARYKKCN